MEYVVDLQGFQRPINEFVVKELAITSLYYDVPPIVFLFGPPIPWSDLPAKYKSVNLWLERNYHYLPWSAGELSYNDVGNVLRSALHDASTVYTKGEQKKKWLQQFGFNVRDIVDCPSLQELYPKRVTKSCPYHYEYETNCALRHVQLLKKYLEQYYVPGKIGQVVPAHISFIVHGPQRY